MTIEDLTAGGSEFLIPAQHKLNPHNGVHGGVVASILDATCYWAAYTLQASVSGEPAPQWLQ